MILSKEELKRAKEIGLDEVPLSLDERESAVEMIFTAYQKPLDISFVKSTLYQAGIKVPNIGNILYLMKRYGKIKRVSRGVYQTIATELNIVSSRVQRKLLDSMGKMFSLNTRRENDIEKLLSKVDQLRREKQEFKKLSDGV